MGRKTRGKRVAAFQIQVDRLEPDVSALLRKRIDTVRTELGVKEEQVALRVLLTRLLRMESELESTNSKTENTGAK